MDLDGAFNKVIDAVTDKSQKKEPYPLEHMGEELSNIVFSLEGIIQRLINAKKNGVIVKNEKKMKILNNMIFKANTIRQLTEASFKDFERLKF